MINFIDKSGKILIISCIVLATIATLFFGARYFIYHKIKRTIIEELDNLKTQGVVVTYDHLDVHPWSGKIEFLNLQVTVRKSSHKQGIDASIPYVLIKGIDIIPFLKSKSLELHEITAEQAGITYSKGSSVFEGNNKKRKIELREIKVDRINLPGVDLYIKDSLANDTIAHLLSHVHMRDLDLRKQLDSLIWNHGEIEVTDFAMRLFRADYGVSAQRATVNIHEKSVSIDSFKLQPTLSKQAFMKKAGRQTTYMTTIVKNLECKDINWFTYPAPMLEIKSVDVKLFLEMFRDKRYPLIQPDKRELPAQFFQKIPIKISVDSVAITDSYVSYEEFPEEGDSTGTVYFEKLRALVVDVHNNPKRKEDIKMYATASFMGSGLLNAAFTFPYDTLSPYRAEGTLENFEMATLNNMLGATAKVKVESGVMSKLKFDFTYNDVRSTGNVALAYDDLKILTLRNKNDEQAVSHFKTLLINTIFIKKDVFNNISSDQRTGDISFERDQHKSMFNFWWKSVFSGVKSAFYIDKIVPQAQDKKDKKKGGKVKDILSKIF